MRFGEGESGGDLDLDLDLEADLDLDPDGLLLTEADLCFSERDPSRMLPRDLSFSGGGEQLRTGLRRPR